MRPGLGCESITFYPLSNLIDSKPQTQIHIEHQKRHTSVFNCLVINCQDGMELSFLILLFSMFPPNFSYLPQSAHPALTTICHLSHSHTRAHHPHSPPSPTYRLSQKKCLDIGMGVFRGNLSPEKLFVL